MKIPNKVKIGGMVYKVVVANDWFEREGADGEMFNDKSEGNVIYIGSELSKESKEITLIHEALHGMNSVMNHEFLDSLSEQIYAFFKDNNIIT